MVNGNGFERGENVPVVDNEKLIEEIENAETLDTNLSDEGSVASYITSNFDESTAAQILQSAKDI